MINKIREFIIEMTQHLSDKDFNVKVWAASSQGTGSTVECHINMPGTTFHWEDIKDYIIPLADVLNDDWGSNFSISMRFDVISDNERARMTTFCMLHHILEDDVQFQGLPMVGEHVFNQKKLQSAVLKLASS